MHQIFDSVHASWDCAYWTFFCGSVKKTLNLLLMLVGSSTRTMVGFAGVPAVTESVTSFKTAGITTAGMTIMQPLLRPLHAPLHPRANVGLVECSQQCQ